MRVLLKRARVLALLIGLSVAVLLSGVGVPDGMVTPVAAEVEPPPAKPERPVNARTLKPIEPAKGAEDRPGGTKATPPVWPAARKSSLTLKDRPTVADGTPVSVAQAAGLAQVGGPGPAGGPATIQVETLPQATVDKLGGTGLAVRLGRLDAGPATRVQVTLDYSRFRWAHGGGWADRLKLVKLPTCVLTAQISDVSCDRRGTEVSAYNNVKAGTLTADVDVTPSTDAASTLLTLAAGASGPTAGNFTATDLRPQSKWAVGPQSGGFSYSVPIPEPPSPGGQGPGLELAYDSSQVDGLTKVTNNQASWVGQAWDISAGYIERRYRSCSSDAGVGKNPNQRGWGDLCWESPEENDGDPATNDATASDLFINVGGQSSRLIKTGTGYKTEQDFGWKIENLTGGDQGSEYWRITTQEGTVYRMGFRAEAIWRVPFVGDDAGEPCHNNYNTSGTYAITCGGVWRWNLDQEADANENIIDYYWTKEVNNYTHGGASLVYDRGGYLDRIEWGANSQVTGSHHTAKLVFNSSSRMMGLDSDIPDDFVCSPAPGGGPVSCEIPTGSPTFFISGKLSSIVGYAWDDAVNDWDNVSQMTLTHQYVYTEGDSPTPVLWLDAIQVKGLAGDDANAITLPSHTFGAVMLDNRVDVGRMPDGEFNDAVRMPRIGTVGNGFGGQIGVTYSHLNPCVTGYQATRIAWDGNTTDCYPVYDGRDVINRPHFAVYRKYLVTKVVEQDLVAGSPPMETRYEYVGAPAWAKEVNYNTRAEQLSWGEFRGYGTVRTIKGSGTAPEGFSVASSQYFRGMYDDVNKDGAKKQVTLTDFDGDTVNDQKTLSGMALESRQWRFTTADPLGTPPAQRGMAEEASTRFAYWQQTTANGPGVHDAVMVRQSQSETREVRGDGSWRRSATSRLYDDQGLEIRLVDAGQLGVADNTCTSTTYARNTASGQWMVSFPSMVEKREGDDCAPSAALLSRKVTLYDGGSDPATNTPTDGNITETRTWVDADTVAIEKATFDDYGRRLTVTDPREKTSTIVYNPPVNWPTGGVTTTNPLGHASTTWASPLHGGVVGVRDANNHDTNVDYDALGRTAALWTAAQPRSGGTPAATFAYQQTGTAPTRTTTSKLLAGTGASAKWQVEHSYLDGFGRAREVQTDSPAGGRIVSVTTYDARGMVAAQSGPAHNTAAPGTGLVNPALTSLPQWSKPIYDGVGRAVAAVDMSGSSELRRTATNYLGADVYEVVPPLGGKTVYHTDVDDQVTKIEEWLNADGQAAAVQGPGLSLDKSGSAGGSGPAESEAAAAASAEVADQAVRVEAMRAASQAAVKQGRRVLVEGATTESSLTYALDDGKSFTTEFSAGPVRVRQGNAWVDVDTTLVASGGVLKPKAALAEVEFSAGGAAGFLARMKRPDGSVFALEWPGALPRPQVKGNVATYVDVAGPGAGPGADLVVTALPAGFRHDVVLRKRPATGLEYRLPVQAEGLTLRTSGEGGLALVDAKGKTAASAPKPVMWDSSAAGKPGRGKQGKIAVEVVDEGGRQVLVLRPDEKFLADPATRYPVTVDPTTTLPVLSDAWISSYGVDGADTHADDWLWVGTYDNVGSLGVERAYLNFDTSAIAGANVSSATLTLRRKASIGCGDSASGIRVQRITAAWNPGTITWGNKPATTTAGQQTAGDFAGCSVPGDMSWDATAFAQAWASGTANNGLMLRGVDETVSGRPYYDRGFDSNEGVVKPGLSVTYTIGSAPSVGLASPAVLPVTTVSGQVTATSLTPQLAVTLADGAGGPLTGEFEVEHDPSVPAQGSGLVWAGSVTGVLTGAVAALTVAPGEIEAGWLVRWRARAVNPGQSTSSAWTAWQSLRVDPAAAPAPVSSPVAHWKLDEGSGTVAGDATGAGRSATLGGSASWTPGIVGGAMTAAGNPSSASTAGPVMRTDQSFTVSAWLNLQDDSDWYEVFRQVGSVKPAFYLGVNPPGKQLEFVIYDNDTSGAIGYGVWAGTVPLKRWFHLTGVYDRTAGRVYLYLNGSQIGTNTVPPTWNAGGTMTLGAVYNGKLDDVRVYQKVLTATEIAALAAGSPAPDRTPTADQTQVTPSSTAGGVTTVTSLTPTVSARVAEPGGQALRAEFQVEHDPADAGHGTGGIWTGSKDNVASGAAASLAVPAGNLGDGWGVRWRARAVRGDTVSAWTSWQSFTVDVPKPSVTAPQLTPSQQVEGVTVTSTVTPQLSAVVTDPAGQALRAEFEVDHDPNAPEGQGSGQIWAGNVPGAASGTQVSATVPAGELMDGWQARWRVRAVNPVGEAASAWSGWHLFTVDVPKPGIGQLQIVPSAQVGEATVTPTLTPSLRGTVSEPAAGQVRAEFEIEHDPEVSGEQGSGQIWAGSSPDVASGQVAAVAVPAGELTDGWKVRWRARAVTVATSVASAWSQWQNLTVALPSGGNLGIDLLQVSPSSVVEGVRVTSSATPSLIGRVFDPSSGNLRAEYEVEHDPAVPSQGSGQIWAGAVDNVPSGTSASLAVPAGNLADGYKVRWRARVLAGATPSAWSDWQSLSVDVADPFLSQLQILPSETAEGATVVLSTTPSLRATLTDPNSGTLRGEFELERDGTQIWSGSVDNVASEAVAAVSVPTGELLDGQTARWRVRAVAAAATSAWSDWHEFTVTIPTATISGLQVVPSQQVNGGTVTSALTPALHATLTDPAGGTLRGEFELEHDPAAPGQGSGQIWSGSVNGAASGANVSVTVPAGKLSDEWQVRWRARAVAAESSSPWSDWQALTVTLPDPTVDQLGVTPSTQSGGTTVTSALTPALDARVTGPAGGTLRAEFEIEHDPAAPGQGSGQIWIGGVDDVSSGTLASITVPAGELADGWKVRWRARAVAVNGTSAWSGWQTLTIELPEGGPQHLDTTFEYDLNGNLTKQIDANGNIRTFTHDLLGRRTAATDPDSGTSQQAYDLAGHLLWSTDGRGQKISYTYDDLGRQLTQWSGEAASGTKLAEWVYDTLSKGHPTSSTRYTAGNAYTSAMTGYDAMDRPTGTTLSIPSAEGLLAGTYTLANTYTASGALDTFTTPAAGGLAAETLTMGYTDQGLPYSLTSNLGDGTTYVKSTAYTNVARLFERAYGANGQIKRTVGWDDGTGWIERVTTTAKADTSSPQTAQDDRYSYDISGEITRVLDASAAISGVTDGQSECFDYDDLHRLTAAWTTTASGCGPADHQGIDPYAQSYQYDAVGNLTTMIDDGQIATYHYPTAGPSSVRPNAVSSITHSGGGTDSYGYDEAGQLTTRTVAGKTGTFTWNPRGQLEKAAIDSQDTSMVYGADGERLIRREPDGTTTLYLGTIELELFGGIVIGKRYYSTSDGALVAMRTAGQSLIWMASGLHGSTQLAINDATGQISRERYLPFGARRGGDDLPFTDRGFLGKIEDSSTDLDYLSARYYDPTIGKFISIDPLLDLRKPQWANPYGYAGNNPIGLSDPSGLAPDGGGGSWGGGGANRGLLPPPAVLNALPNEKARAEFRKRWAKHYRDWLNKTHHLDAVRADNTPEADRLRVRDAAQIAYDICGEMNCGMDAWNAAVGTVLNSLNLDDVPLYGEGIRPPGSSAAGKGASGRNSRTCGSSFKPGTKVLMADGTVKPIEDVEPGDKVAASDPDANATHSETVLTLISSQGQKRLVHITMESAKQANGVGVTATDSHPFWVENLREWLPAKQLQPGMWLRTAAGTYTQISAVKTWETPSQRVHNLSVSGPHTYYVLAGIVPVLVHNSSGCPKAGLLSSYTAIGDPQAKGGVYALVSADGRVIRTGVATNLKTRLGQHKRKYPGLTGVVLFRTDNPSARRGLEEMVENWYTPILAGQRGIRFDNPRRKAYVDAARKFLDQWM